MGRRAHLRAPWYIPLDYQYILYFSLWLISQMLMISIGITYKEAIRIRRFSRGNLKP